MGHVVAARTFPDFVEPCLPRQADRPPAGPDWIHEIKHDGFRLLARRGAAGVRLFTRNGHDWTERFPLIVGALKAASSRRAAFSICSVELNGAFRLLYLLSTMLRDEGASILQ